VIRETRGDYATLQRLNAQQPGSAIVQTASGEYVLIKSKGLNLSNQSTLGRINENIEREGGQQYSPTRVPQAGGGFLNLRKISDTVTTSEPVPPEDSGPVISQSDFILDKSRPTKYTAKVGEGSVLVEQGALYQIGLSDSMGGLAPEKRLSQKEAELFWKYHPRELARGISEGIYEKQFLGQRGPDIIAYEKIGKEAEEPQVFPITYTDKEGKEVFTITGKSPEGEFAYTIPDREKEAYLSNLLLAGKESKVEANKIFPFPLEAPKKQLTEFELAKQAAVNIAVDITGASMTGGVPQYTKPVKEELGKYRKETQVDLLFQPERYGEIRPLSKEFLIPAGVYASTLLIGGGRTFPARIERTTIPTAPKPGIPIFGKPEGSETIYTGLKVGYGKYAVRAGGKTSEGQIVVGTPKPTQVPLEKLTPPSARGGFPISEETSGLLTTKPYLTELVRVGKITPTESQYIQSVKRGLEITEGTKDVVKRTDLGKAPVSSLRERETSRTFELIVQEQKAKTIPAVKGSLPQQYFVKEDYLRRSRDIDIQLRGTKQEARGPQTIKLFKTELQKVAEPGRTFETKGLTLKVKEKTPSGVREEKVMELLTKSEGREQYPSTDPSKVFGLKVPFKETKPKDIKTITYRFQGLRKASSATELTGKGVRPAAGREKDILDLVGYFETKAEQLGGKKGVELKTIAGEIKGYAKEKGIWTTEGRETVVFELPKKIPISEYAYIAVKETKPLLAPSTSLLVGTKPKEERYGYQSPSKISRSIYRPTSLSISRPISKPISKPLSKPIYQIPSKPISYQPSKPISKPTPKPGFPLTSRPISLPPSKPIPIYSYPPSKRPPSRPITSPPSRYTTKISPPLKVPPLIPIIPPVEPTRKLLLPTIKGKPERKKGPSEPKSAFSWKGNVPEFQIEGVYKKYDIIYGEKRIAKLLKEERFGKPKRKAKKQYDILGFPKTKKAKSSKWAF
jgi:hypothetical protein